MADEVFYQQHDQEEDCSDEVDEIIYLREVTNYKWEGQVCRSESVMIPVAKKEYIGHLLDCEGYLCCTKNDKKWGIRNKQIDTWFIYTDTAKYEVWHGKDYEKTPENHLFKFLIGSRVFATTIVDAPKVIEFLTAHFEGLFDRNKPIDLKTGMLQEKL